MIINKESRKKLIDEYYHKEEEIFLRTLDLTDNEIKKITQTPINYDTNEYKDFSIGHLKEDLKDFVTDEYYKTGGIDFDSDMALELLYDKEYMLYEKINNHITEENHKIFVDDIKIIFGVFSDSDYPLSICYFEKDNTICSMKSRYNYMEHFINFNRSKKLKDILS
jgi:hypothetical protein